MAWAVMWIRDLGWALRALFLDDRLKNRSHVHRTAVWERGGGLCFNQSRGAVGCETYVAMPEKQTIKRARRDKREGKSTSTQAGEFVREEMEHIRAGEHGARSAKQAIAIGLSKARRAGVKLAPPEKGMQSEKVRKQAKRDLAKGAGGAKKPSARRSRAVMKALQKEGTAAASHRALSRQAHAAAGKRTKAERSAAAKKGARTRARGQ